MGESVRVRVCVRLCVLESVGVRCWVCEGA